MLPDDFKLLFKKAAKPWKIIKLFKDFMKIGLNPLMVNMYLTELYLDRNFWSYINNEIRKAQQLFSDPRLGGWMLSFPAVMIYPIVRITKPEIVIETGVGPGGSTALILNALNRNNKGHLYSIDLPGYDSIVYPKIKRCYNIHIPPGYKVGWLVPQWLERRWTLILGDSRQKLPELLSEIGSVDLFLHDSLHTDEHVMFELNTVWPKLSRKGLLLADDVNEYWTLAFVDFCLCRSLSYIVVGSRLGIAIKR